MNLAVHLVAQAASLFELRRTKRAGSLCYGSYDGRCVAAFVFLLLPQVTEPEVTATLSSDKILIAQPFTLEVQVVAPRGTKVTWPELGDTLGPCTVLDARQRDAIPIENNPLRRQWQNSIRLEAMEPGDIKLPSFAITLQLPSASSGPTTTALNTNPVTVQVQSVLTDADDPQKIRDLKGVADLPVVSQATAHRWWWILLATGALAAVGYFVYRRRSRLPRGDRWALEQIDLVERSYSTSAISYDAAIENLSRLIREYLEIQFGMTAVSRSSEEIADDLADSTVIAPEQRQRLTAFLSHADQVRFAGRAPDSDAASPFDTVRQMIRSTAASDGGTG